MVEHFDTLIVGGGQAGLAVSYYLTQQGREHLILEKRRIGESWRIERWDSFTLVSPNWTLRLPGFSYQGDDPDGFLTRDQVIRYLEDYAASFNPPVRLNVEVTCIEGIENGFRVETSQGIFEASNVVVATGMFQQPKIPAYAAQISPHIRQLHSSQYRNPHQLPLGAVLVVGSGQSGCQIAEELYQHGRKVYLCTGKAGRLPRRYRGKDVFRWVDAVGGFDQTVDTLNSPAERFEVNPQLTGKEDGHSLSLHQFALDGVTLLGRLKDASGSQVFLAADLFENLTASDKFASEFKAGMDKYIEKTGLQAPPADDLHLSAGYDAPTLTELDLDEAGITSIIWAAGYLFDFSWVKSPIFDEFGYPIHQRGVSIQPGLYFIGLQWLHKSNSNLLMGVGDDAAHIATHIANCSS